MLRAENLNFKVAGFALQNINLSIAGNEYFVLLGPTGSGKSTLVKCISGLYRPTKGYLYLNGEDITHKEPEARGIGYLPQNYALFPHLKVQENIFFGVKVRNLSLAESQRHFEQIVEILKLGKLLKREIKNLSGGEMQRIALARALMVQPKALLLDEPFSAIDTGLKAKLWFELKDILKTLNIPILHITHNLDEASVLGEKVALLINGKIEQQGSSQEVFLKPKTEAVALYLGIKNIYCGKVVELTDKKLKLECQGFTITALKDQEYQLNQEVKFCIRPQDIKIIKEGLPVKDELKDNLFEGEITYTYFCNDYCLMGIKAQGEFELRFPAYIYKRYNLAPGKKITLGLWQESISLLH